MTDYLIELDKSALLFINSHNNAFFDNFFYIVSDKYVWIPLYIALLIAVWFKSGKSIKQTLTFVVFIALLILCADQTCTSIFKNNVQRLRPCHDGTISNMVHLVNNYCGGKYGFISSHAANFFALAGFTSLYFKNRYYTSIAFFLAILTCYSRIYLGVHFPGDIICGAWAGFTWSLIIYILFDKFMKKKFKENYIYGRF